MYSKSDNIDIMMNEKADEIIEETFNSLKNRSQNNLESLKGSEFVFSYVCLLYYKCHETNLDRGGLYKNKKTTVNPINKKDVLKQMFSKRCNSCVKL